RTVDLADMAHRHFAGAEAVEAHARLHFGDFGAELLLQFRLRDGDVVNAQETFGAALGELHGMGFRHSLRAAANPLPAAVFGKAGLWHGPCPVSTRARAGWTAPSPPPKRALRADVAELA